MCLCRLQLNRSISQLLASNRARSYRSNTEEFVRPAKRQRVAGPDGEPQAPEELFSSARTSALKVDRDVQMKYDIAKNPEGPLGRTMLGKLPSSDPRTSPGQGSGGVLSPMLTKALATHAEPTLARHPGLRERYEAIEGHLGIRWGM